VHPNSKNIIASAGTEKPLQYNLDMSFIIVPPDQKKVPVKVVQYPGDFEQDARVHAKAMDAVRKPGVGVEVVVSRDVLGLGIHYRWSSLAEEHDHRAEVEGAVRAGDRAPDAPCHTADGRPIRLLDRCGGGVFTLLGFGSRAWAALAGRGSRLRTLRIGSEANSGDPVDLIDTDGHARRAYGMAAGGLVLVRPDLHVALTAPADGAGTVRAYLCRLGHPVA
jgi:hypothetical protein